MPTISMSYNLKDQYGNPPQQGGGAYVGNEQSTVASMLNILAIYYGKRIISIDIKAKADSAEVKRLIEKHWGRNAMVTVSILPP